MCIKSQMKNEDSITGQSVEVLSSKFILESPVYGGKATANSVSR